MKSPLIILHQDSSYHSSKPDLVNSDRRQSRGKLVNTLSLSLFPSLSRDVRREPRKVSMRSICRSMNQILCNSTYVEVIYIAQCQSAPLLSKNKLANECLMSTTAAPNRRRFWVLIPEIDMSLWMTIYMECSSATSYSLRSLSHRRVQ